MLRAFADTGYWIALLNPRDELHQSAVRLSRDYAFADVLTSEVVLTEFLNAFSDYGSALRHAATAAVTSLKGSGAVIVPQSSALFAQALRLYEKMNDTSWSLTDCSSFVIMETHHLSDALTHDRHFMQAGFQALLR